MIDKAEIKKSILHSAGCEADDWLEGAHKNAHAFEGAKQSLRKAAKDVQAIVQFVQKDLDDGKFEGMEPPEMASYAILQITRCVDSLQSSSLHYTNRQIAAQGEVAAYEKLVNHYQKLVAEEERKIDRFNSAVASGEIIVEEDGTATKKAGNGHISGVRPAGGIAAQRKAEAAAEAEAAKGEAPAEETAAAPEKPKKKRRKRKSKKDEVAKEAETSDGQDA
jgi:hypothetical protein